MKLSGKGEAISEPDLKFYMEQLEICGGNQPTGPADARSGYLLKW